MKRKIDVFFTEIKLSSLINLFFFSSAYLLNEKKKKGVDFADI
jgi:hypothetical protein